MLQGQSNKNSIKLFILRNLENSKSALEKLISSEIAAFEV